MVVYRGFTSTNSGNSFVQSDLYKAELFNGLRTGVRVYPFPLNGNGRTYSCKILYVCVHVVQFVCVVQYMQSNHTYVCEMKVHVYST